MNTPLPPANTRRAIRSAAGITRTELAKRIGVSYQSIYQWEKGVDPTSWAHVEQYRSVLAELVAGLQADGFLIAPLPDTSALRPSTLPTPDSAPCGDPAAGDFDSGT